LGLHNFITGQENPAAVGIPKSFLYIFEIMLIVCANFLEQQQPQKKLRGFSAIHKYLYGNIKSASANGISASVTGK
jgi:hypothetical protein